MLDEFRSTLITWDKATSRIYSPVTANASDENGRKLVVQIVNSGQVEDLTGATLHLYWETRDKLHDGLDVFKAVDLKKGEFELSYTTGMLSNQGVLNANLVLIDTVGRVVSERFKITVTEGIDDDAIQSENSFSSLTQALIDVSNLEQNYAPRLNDLTAQLAQTDVELRRKRELEDLSPTVLEAIEGGEGTNFNLLSIPQDESVNQKKLQKAKYLKVKSINRFDKSKATQGFIHSASGRAANANWYTTDFFTPVNLGDVIRVNLPYATTIILYDDNSNYLSAKGAVTNNVPLEYTVGVGVKSVKFNIYKDNIDSFMFTINQPLPVAYEPFSEDLIAVPWLTPEYNSINPSHFTNDVIPFIQEKIEVPTPSENKKSDWEGKKFVSLGTSITFQDGKTYQQGNIGAIARGYQTIMKEKLGFDGYLNKGMSGKPLANGTTAGEGILETGKSTSYADYDLVTIEVGTNDFKLNVPIGAKGMIGDVAFDNTTFFGAFRELLEFILSVKPSIRIVLLTPLQRDNGGYNVNTANPSGHKLINYVNAIEEIGEMYGLPVCDLYRNSGFTKKTLAIFTMDGLHPNDVGYARMGNTLSGLVKNVGV